MKKPRVLMAGAGGQVEGLVRLERVLVTCPACHQSVETVASDGRVKGYCTVVGRYVDFPAETARRPDADTRARMSQAARKRQQDPAYRAKISQAAKKRWQDPEFRARLSELTRERQQDPAYRARMSEVIKKQWQDPEFRAKRSQAVKKRR